MNPMRVRRNPANVFGRQPVAKSRSFWNGCNLIAGFLSVLALSGFLQYISSGSPPLHPSFRQRDVVPKSPVLGGGPIAIIHIGPRKTATTTIQYVLGQNLTRTLLRKDSFFYLGKGLKLYNRGPMNFMRRCFERHKRCRDNANWIDFVDRIQTHHSNNENIIISEEMFPHVMRQDDSFQMLEEALKGWNVRIIATYRRYHDWLLSEYNQENKRANHIIPFTTWYQEKRSNPVFMPLDQTLKERWQEYFPTFGIFNMHEGSVDDLMERFLCNMIPEAKAVCQAARQGKLPIVPSGHQQQSDLRIDAKMIAQAAVNAKIVQSVDQEEIAKEVNAYIDNSSGGEGSKVTVPLTCLADSELDEVLDKSLQTEIDMVPDFFNSGDGEQALREGFTTAVNDKKFCNVDAEKALKDKEWQKFLRSFNSGKRGEMNT